MSTNQFAVNGGAFHDTYEFDDFDGTGELPPPSPTTDTLFTQIGYYQSIPAVQAHVPPTSDLDAQLVVDLNAARDRAVLSAVTERATGKRRRVNGALSLRRIDRNRETQHPRFLGAISIKHAQKSDVEQWSTQLISLFTVDEVVALSETHLVWMTDRQIQSIDDALISALGREKILRILGRLNSPQLHTILRDEVIVADDLAGLQVSFETIDLLWDHLPGGFRRAILDKLDREQMAAIHSRLTDDEFATMVGCYQASVLSIIVPDLNLHRLRILLRGAQRPIQPALEQISRETVGEAIEKGYADELLKHVDALKEWQLEALVPHATNVKLLLKAKLGDVAAVIERALRSNAGSGSKWRLLEKTAAVQLSRARSPSCFGRTLEAMPPLLLAVALRDPSVVQRLEQLSTISFSIGALQVLFHVLHPTVALQFVPDHRRAILVGNTNTDLSLQTDAYITPMSIAAWMDSASLADRAATISNVSGFRKATRSTIYGMVQKKELENVLGALTSEPEEELRLAWSSFTNEVQTEAITAVSEWFEGDGKREVYRLAKEFAAWKGVTDYLASRIENYSSSEATESDWSLLQEEIVKHRKQWLSHIAEVRRTIGCLRIYHCASDDDQVFGLMGLISLSSDSIKMYTSRVDNDLLGALKQKEINAKQAPGQENQRPVFWEEPDVVFGSEQFWTDPTILSSLTAIRQEVEKIGVSLDTNPDVGWEDVVRSGLVDSFQFILNRITTPEAFFSYIERHMKREKALLELLASKQIGPAQLQERNITVTDLFKYIYRYGEPNDQVEFLRELRKEIPHDIRFDAIAPSQSRLNYPSGSASQCAQT